MKTIIKMSEYKGHEVMQLVDGDTDTVIMSFGKRKAQCIASCVPEIVEFANKED